MYELTLLVVFAIIIYLALSQKYIFPQPKTLPVQAAMREVVGRCVELGRSVVSDPGRWSSMSSSRSMSGFAGLSILGHIASLCAELDCPFSLVTQNAAALPLMTETIESQYVAYPNSTKPEIRFLPSIKGNPYELAFVAMAERENAGAVISIGPLGSSSGIRIGALTRTDAMTIMGTDKPDLVSFMAICSDYIVIGEEIYVLGAVLGGDESMTNVIGAQDLIKAISIALILIALLLNNFGFPLKL